MRALRNSKQNTRDMITEKLLGVVPKLLIGALMGAVVGLTGGWAIIGALGLIAVGIGVDTALAQHHAQSRKEEITRYFEKEIGAAIGKDPDSVTVKDAEAAVRGETLNGQPILVVQNCFESINKIRKNEIISGAIANVLSGVLSFGGGTLLGWLNTSANIPGLSGKVTTSVAQALFGSSTTKIVTDTVTQTYANYHPAPKSPVVFEDLRALEKRMDYNDPIPAFPLMTTVLRLRPALQEKIREEFGEPFEALDQLQKRQAFEEMEETLHLREAARKLTHGEITLPQFGVMLFGQQPLSPPPPLEYVQGRKRAQAMRAQNVAQTDAGKDALATIASTPAPETKPPTAIETNTSTPPVASFVEKHRPERAGQSAAAPTEPVLWQEKMQHAAQAVQGENHGLRV